MTLRGSALTPTDLEMFSKCGISSELARAAMLRRVSSDEGAEIIGRNGNGDYNGIAIPYVWPARATSANTDSGAEIFRVCVWTDEY